MESYEDMRRIVRRKFNIDECAEVAFEVCDFDVCKNELVEVDETVYPVMSPFIDELHLSVTNPEPAGSSGSNTKGKERELYPTPTPNPSDDSVVRDEDDVQQAVPSSQPSNRVLSPKGPSPKARVELAVAQGGYPEGDNEDEVDANDKQDAAGPSEPKFLSPPSPPSPTKTASRTKAPSVTPITSTPPPVSRPKTKTADRGRSVTPDPSNGGGSGSNHNADELFNDSVVVENDVMVVDPPAEPEPEPKHEPEPEPEPESEYEPQGFTFGSPFFGGKHKAKKDGKRQNQAQPHEVIDVDLEEPPRYEEAGPSSHHPSTLEPRAQDFKDEDSKPISKSKRAGPSKSTNFDDDVSAQNQSSTSNPRPKKGTAISRNNSARDYDETGPPATQGPVLHEPPEDQENENDLIQPDGRFKIFITGPLPDHRAEFMTKSRHVIRKVLLGACKTFKLDPKRSHLEQLVIVPEDDGDRELYFQCDNGDTVHKAGLRPGSELRVVTDNDEMDNEDY